MTEKLKPCPFCGGSNLKLFGESAPEWWVNCEDCHASSECRSTRTNAIAAWNRRAAPAGEAVAASAIVEAYELARAEWERAGGYLGDLVAKHIGSMLAPRPAAIPEAWIPVSERLPEIKQTVLATYTNRAGKPRTIRAKYVTPKTIEADPDADDSCSEYDEATDTYWLQGGWYEQIDNWGDYSAVQVCEGEVTHWQPMPVPPIDAAPRLRKGE